MSQRSNAPMIQAVLKICSLIKALWKSQARSPPASSSVSFWKEWKRLQKIDILVKEPKTRGGFAAYPGTDLLVA